MWFFASLKPQPSRPSRRVPSSFRPRLEALEDRTLLNAGDLDTSFGGTGIVTTSLSNNDDMASAVLIQPWDGKLVAAGSTHSPSGTRVMGLARYQTNGNLDPSFGSGGKVVSNIGSGWFPPAALYPSTDLSNPGKIIVASGETVARFNSNGSLDTTFKGGSVQVKQFIFGVVIQPDGTIVVAGSDSSYTAFELTRLNANGKLDTSFGRSGTATLSMGPSTYASALGLQADGKLVVAGVTGSPSVWELARFNANGTLDYSFGPSGTGTVTTSFAGGGLAGLTIYPSTGTDTTDSGKIVAVGYQLGNHPVQIALARYNANGTLDASFGQSGQVITSPPYGGDAKAPALQTDGKVVVAAATDDASGNFLFSVLRYNTDGSPDTTFGNGGLVQTGSPGSEAYAVAIQADGKIVAAGDTALVGSTRSDFMVARYLGAVSTTGAPPILPDPVSVGTDLTLAADPVPALAFQRDAVGAGVLEPCTDTLLGYGTRPRDETLTQSSASAGWASGPFRLVVQAQDSDSVFGDPFALPLTVP